LSSFGNKNLINITIKDFETVYLITYDLEKGSSILCDGQMRIEDVVGEKSSQPVTRRHRKLMLQLGLDSSLQESDN